MRMLERVLRLRVPAFGGLSAPNKGLSVSHFASVRRIGVLLEI